MMISTKGRYALKIMIDLAENAGERPVNIKSVSKRQDISVKYIEQIISSLVKAGFVKSVRGSQGGYFLTRSPEQYSVGEILRAAEGDISPVECVSTDKTPCSKENICLLRPLWKELDEAVNHVVDNHTLKDIMGGCEKTDHGVKDTAVQNN